MWEDLEDVDLFGPHPSFASSDFIDLNLMKYDLFNTENCKGGIESEDVLKAVTS